MGEDPDTTLPPTAAATVSGAGARRRHVSSLPEAVVTAVWAVFGAVFMILLLHTGADMMNGVSGVVVFGGLALLVLLFAFVRSRTRTIRPRHFTWIEGLSALWLGVGGGITHQILSPAGFDGPGVPLGTAVAASIVLVLPLLGCSLWLAVRGR